MESLFDYTEPTRVSAFELLRAKTFKPIKKKSDRHLLLEEVTTTLKIPNDRGLYFQCKNLTNPEIREAFDSARKWEKNPAALFRKLIKGKALEIKERLKI